MVIQNKGLGRFVVRKNKPKFESSKVFALFLTSMILIGLIASGPASALIIGSDVKDSNGAKEFTVWLNPNSGDKLAVTELKLQITGLPDCTFDIDGNENCDGITIERITSPDKPGNGPKPGYGYENANNDRLAYRITVTGLTCEGVLKFLVKIGKGNKYFSKEIPFGTPCPAASTPTSVVENKNPVKNKPGKNK